MYALFVEMDDVLTKDDKPSRFLACASECGQLAHPPFDRLLALADTQQSPKHHPEGNVWNHTMLTLDMAARVKKMSTNPRVFMWAALLHDLGKPETTRPRKGRITSYGHDRHGAVCARVFLSALTDEHDLIEAVVKLVRWHMQPLFVLKDMPYADLKTMCGEVAVTEAALLSFCDRTGRLYADCETELAHTCLFLKYCQISEYEAAEYCGNIRHLL